MSTRTYRIGLTVPSSNTTMETEIPAMLQRRMEIKENERFTFHSSRMRMQTVSKEELTKMDSDSDRCAIELSDARCDAIAYACLIAIMAQGPGYHVESEKRLCHVVTENGGDSPVISSAGALVAALDILKAKRVALITPYMKPLTQMVIDYLNSFEIEVVDSISLEVPDNLEVGKLDPMNLVNVAEGLKTVHADVLILSACVQMPSLPAIEIVENQKGLPVISAATSTVYQLLKHLNLETVVPHAGKLLSGEYRGRVLAINM